MNAIAAWLRAAVAQRRAWSGFRVATIALAVGTLALLPLREHLAVSTIGLLFVIPVLVTAVVGDRWSSLAAVVAADLLVNFFFVPPYHTFQVHNADDLILLLVYLLVALAVSLAVDIAVRSRATADQLANHASRLSEIDQLRTALLAAVSHDLRTPLAGIKAAVSSLSESEVDIPAGGQAELLATVEESTDQLTTLVDNLLSASRLQAGQLSVHPQAVALDGVTAAALVSTGAEAVFDVPEDLPLVHADPGLLEHVIVNLVRNAQQADPVWPIRITGRVHNERAELAMIDRGPGLAETEWEAMFTPFHRSSGPSTNGLGLGLTVVKGFTEAMGGRVAPSHTTGGGLTMTLTLPLAHPEQS
jgi:two-component system sensor histidine kinase KdpD